VICPDCNAEQPDGARFCNQCGAKLPAPVPIALAPDWHCPACGFENQPGSKFCSECGEKLAVMAMEAAPPKDAPIRFVSPRGVIYFPPNETHTWLIGREDPVNDIHPDVDLTPYDPEATVSRRHAQLTLAGRQCLLTSIASTNGTKLNGATLTPQQATLVRPGDRIEFGRCAVTLELEV
jgi:hypothetical protein